MIHLVSFPRGLYEFGFDKRHVSLGVALEVLFSSYLRVDRSGVFVCETIDLIQSSFSSLTLVKHFSLSVPHVLLSLFSLHIILFPAERTWKSIHHATGFSDILLSIYLFIFLKTCVSTFRHIPVKL